MCRVCTIKIVSRCFAPHAHRCGCQWRTGSRFVRPGNPLISACLSAFVAEASDISDSDHTVQCFYLLSTRFSSLLDLNVRIRRVQRSLNPGSAYWKRAISNCQNEELRVLRTARMCRLQRLVMMRQCCIWFRRPDKASRSYCHCTTNPNLITMCRWTVCR